MGLTIHYTLQSSTRSPKQARELVTRLHKRALDLPLEKVHDIIDLGGPACDYQQGGQDNPHRWLLIQAGHYLNDPRHDGYSYSVTPTHVIAFSTWPGQGCEPANYGLCLYPTTIEVDDPVSRGLRRTIRTGLSGWRWGSFCKTEYASDAGMANFLRRHVAVVRMLDRAQEVGLAPSVHDESDYWQTRDIVALARRQGGWNENVAAWAKQVKGQTGDRLFGAIACCPSFAPVEAAT